MDEQAGGGAGGVVLITGGANGLGQGIALELAQAGWAVGIADIDGEALAATVAQCAETGTAAGWELDVSDADAVERFVSEAEQELGPATGLVNNVIDARPGFFLDLSPSDWRRAIDVSLTSYFLCGQVVARRMVERGYGRIVNMSSGSAERGIPRTAAYACAKGAVNSLTRVMAVELATTGVVVNTLTTGPIMTRSFADIAASADGVEARRRRVPVGRLGEIGDFIAALSYLLSPAAAWTTGGLFHVDGGANNAALVQNVSEERT